MKCLLYFVIPIFIPSELESFKNVNVNFTISNQGIIVIIRIGDVADHLDTAIKVVALVHMKMIEEIEDIMIEEIEVVTEEVIVTTAVPDLQCQAGNAITIWVAVIGVVEEVVVVVEEVHQ